MQLLSVMIIESLTLYLKLNKNHIIFRYSVNNKTWFKDNEFVNAHYSPSITDFRHISGESTIRASTYSDTEE